MKVRLRRSLIVATLVALVVMPLAAQGGPLTVLRMLFVLQQQVDALQREHDGPGELDMRVHLDSVFVTSPGVITVNGWAFSCMDPQAKVVVEVDGLQSVQFSPSGVWRYLRGDVNLAYAGLCPMPVHVGVLALVDLSVFEPGWNGDHQHSVRLRLYDALGRMKQSNAINVATQ